MERVRPGRRVRAPGPDRGRDGNLLPGARPERDFHAAHPQRHRAAAEGTIRFIKSGQSAPIVEGTLLELAEAAGLSPDYGCRLGICKTCTCRKSAGTVRNLITGEVSAEEDEEIQLCVSVPAGALEI